MGNFALWLLFQHFCISSSKAQLFSSVYIIKLDIWNKHMFSYNGIIKNMFTTICIDVGGIKTFAKYRS